MQLTGNSVSQGNQTISGWIAGATYTFSCWSKQDGTASGGIALRYTAGGTNTDTYLPNPGTAYSLNSMNITLPSNTTAVQILFWNNWGTNWYDDVSLVKQ